MRQSSSAPGFRFATLLLLALTAAALLLPEAGLAAETQWRFDATAAYVYGPWTAIIAIGAPVRGLLVLDRGVPFVQNANPCDTELDRVFHAVRAAQFSTPGASGAGTTPVAPGVDCAPGGICDLAVAGFNALDPPACGLEVYDVRLDSGPLASPVLGDVDLEIGYQPALTPPAFYSAIPDAPWAALGGFYGTLQSLAPAPYAYVQLEVTSLERAQVCGDIDLDLDVDAVDRSLLREALADPAGAALSAGEASRCSVIGGASDCDVVDVAVLGRVLAGEPEPGIQPVCASMNGGGT